MEEFIEIPAHLIPYATVAVVIALIADVKLKKYTLTIRERLHDTRQYIVKARLKKLTHAVVSWFAQNVETGLSSVCPILSCFTVGVIVTLSLVSLSIVGLEAKSGNIDKMHLPALVVFTLWLSFAASPVGGITACLCRRLLLWGREANILWVLLLLVIAKIAFVPMLFLIVGLSKIIGAAAFMYSAVRYHNPAPYNFFVDGLFYYVSFLLLATFGAVVLIPFYTVLYLLEISVLFWLISQLTSFVDDWINHLIHKEEPFYFAPSVGLIFAIIAGWETGKEFIPESVRNWIIANMLPFGPIYSIFDSITKIH